MNYKKLSSKHFDVVSINNFSKVDYTVNFHEYFTFHHLLFSLISKNKKIILLLLSITINFYFVSSMHHEHFSILLIRQRQRFLNSLAVTSSQEVLNYDTAVQRCQLLDEGLMRSNPDLLEPGQGYWIGRKSVELGCSAKSGTSKLHSLDLQSWLTVIA